MGWGGSFETSHHSRTPKFFTGISNVGVISSEKNELLLLSNRIFKNKEKVNELFDKIKEYEIKYETYQNNRYNKKNTNVLKISKFIIERLKEKNNKKKEYILGGAIISLLITGGINGFSAEYNYNNDNTVDTPIISSDNLINTEELSIDESNDFYDNNIDTTNNEENKTYIKRI